MPRFKQLTILAVAIAVVLVVAGKHRSATSPAPNRPVAEPTSIRPAGAFEGPCHAAHRAKITAALSQEPFLAWAGRQADAIDARTWLADHQALVG